MRGRHDFDPGWFGWLGWLLPLILLGVLVAVAIVFVYSYARRPQSPSDGDPLRRAARRYAAGEIERVEFERIQRDLGGAADPLRSAAARLARGEITVDEFDALRGAPAKVAVSESAASEAAETAGEDEASSESA